MALLDRIQKPNDIKKIPAAEYDHLAEEIRQFLVEKVSVTGGHLSSNLGAVELTMALHLSLDLPKDRIIWDVGHQSYTHKLLTGRKEGFDSLRLYGGMSGFPKRNESSCDSYDTGHSSTSISAALGLARARDLCRQDGFVVAVIGDGAMTGGLAYEALNNMARLNSNLIIILNDNDMSISKNVGGLSKYLGSIRTSNSYIQLRDRIHDSLNDTMPKVVKGISRAKQSLKSFMLPGMFFEEMGITYLGPVDGHNVRDMVRAIEDAKRVNKAVLIHACTKKGKGYGPAEKNPSRFHGTPPFDIRTGEPLQPPKGTSYTGVFSKAMLRLAKEEPHLVGVTAAMEDGVGLKEFHRRYPRRFFDVGIAEQHAVVFAAGMAAGGMKPVVAVYSTFLQRAYDQIVEDVCLQQLPVVFAIDRAGIVGADGETHHGIFDVSYLRTVPGMKIFCPASFAELQVMLKTAVCETEGPAAIRYPRGGECGYGALHPEKEAVLQQGSDLTLVTYGTMICEVQRAAGILKERGISAEVIKLGEISGEDFPLVLASLEKTGLLLTAEEVCEAGFLGTVLSALAAEKGIALQSSMLNLGGGIIPHGGRAQLLMDYSLDAASIAARGEELVRERGHE